MLVVVVLVLAVLHPYTPEGAEALNCFSKAQPTQVVGTSGFLQH